MYRGVKVAVVMPIHNEQDHVGRAFSRVPGWVDTVIAVDDGSSDESWRMLREISDDRLKRLRHRENLGVGAATKTGYRYALENSSEFIAVMDGDGQMDGRDLHRLLDLAIAGCDYVKGNRFLHRESIGSMPLPRYIGNKILSWLTERAAGVNDSLDAQCGYAVIRRRALERLDLNELYDGYGFPNDMVTTAYRAGLLVGSAAVRSVYDDEISGINPLKAVPIILFLIARSWIRRRRHLGREVTFLQVAESETDIPG